MSELSLQKSIRTCKVDTGNSARLDSERWLNVDNLLCPVWTGRDLSGRQVCADSFFTKREGCNSATDRITVENDLRPKYFDYIALNAAGVTGNIYGGVSSAAMSNHVAQTRSINNVSGNFGQQFDSDIRNTACSINPYDAQVKAMHDRQKNATLNAYFNNGTRGSSGF